MLTIIISIHTGPYQRLSVVVAENINWYIPIAICTKVRASSIFATLSDDLPECLILRFKSLSS